MAELIRISKVGGRYLVFEVKDVATLRREHCICAVFVGTTPQNPNQNVFSGLPIELLAEEAKLLVDKGAAFIADDATSHLTPMDASTKQAYLQSLKTRRRIFQRAADEEKVELQKIGEKMKAASLAKKAASDSSSAADNSLFESSSAPRKTGPSLPGVSTLGRHITPTTSVDILADPQAHRVSIQTPRAYPLYKHLNAGGYYITPGIRFGADYSVYPGDPFRYHAHFMATSFEWDEEITVLDLVTGGRLGTGVKKGFLIGGEAPSEEAAQGAGKDRVRAFTIEWAAM
ncbi:SEN34 subunit of tRNA-splicing endonuclease [Cryphonectria parasitica EP155]|uniref:tRNA-splicing endonuclease subunit Sen34 n=1 Tax=Cryphonectria parasitica (strain ATCC 38755 / EP155) TaxID=660469 RepID=A0A9P4Y6S0_CRYP1|nr:SEN34 subunit of tRNA-splicing endonuclease [Cryphonectria parasitica EP155]KAF3767489.1 SEN34 subunit of tRNA-splicing endonuclease [Cryphonectria parasitica EP155]